MLSFQSNFYPKENLSTFNSSTLNAPLNSNVNPNVNLIEPTFTTKYKEKSSTASTNLLSTIPKGLQEIDISTVVIGLIGNSQQVKLHIIEILTRIKNFTHEGVLELENVYNFDKCRIDLYRYIEGKNDVVFLNLVSLHDSEVLASLSKLDIFNTSEYDFQLWIEKQEYQYLRALLYLFYCSHHILMIQTGTSFYLPYLKILRVLKFVRQNITGSILTYLFETAYVDLKAAPYFPGKCVPNLHFVFQTNIPNLTTEKRKKLEKNLDVHIRFLLEKTNLADYGHINASMLFSLDSTGFVFVFEKKAEPSNSLTNLIINSVQQDLSFLSLTSPPAPVTSKYHSHSPFEQEGEGVEAFRKLMNDQIRIFQVDSKAKLTFKLWNNAAQALQELFLSASRRSGNRGYRNLGDAVESIARLKTYIDPDYFFSSNRCTNAMAIAKVTYLTKLPTSYTIKFHEKQFQKALQTFYQNGARGPACALFENRLNEDCVKTWQDLGQICDAISLTGHPCIYRIHGTDQEHKSNFETINACSCGRKLSLRIDPFELKQDRLFFSELEKECCNELDHFQFPNSTNTSPYWSVHLFGDASMYQSDIGVQQEGFLKNCNFLLPFELVLPENSHQGSTFSLNNENIGLGKMIHLARKLQTFNSSIYSSLNFADKTNDSKNTNDNESFIWEEGDERDERRFNRKHRYRKERKQEKLPLKQSTKIEETQKKIVTGYIGYEYECICQHRFFLDPSMDALLQMMDSGHLHLPTASWEVKRNFILSSDLPLYFPCVECLTANTENTINNAQLQRIFLVTPNLSSLMKIHPTVQFGNPESHQKFNFDMMETTLTLPSNCFLCLCCPYSYYDHTSSSSKVPPYIQAPSKENQSYSNSLFLKGSIFSLSSNSKK